MSLTPGDRNTSDLVAAATPGLREALRLLLEAQVAAEHEGVDVWEFALGLATLQEVGLTVTQLRCLLHEGYVQQGVETTSPGARLRGFDRIQHLGVAEHSCFVLTPAGIARVRPLLSEYGGTPGAPAAWLDCLPEGLRVPVWSRQQLVLTWTDLLVKRLRRDSVNQILLLDAFEEEHWPASIDDPLPGAAEDRVERLRDTLRRLNRGQRQARLHFAMDDSACRVEWRVGE